LHGCGIPVDLDLNIEAVPYRLSGDLQIIMSLKVDPKLRRRPEETPQPQRGGRLLRSWKTHSEETALLSEPSLAKDWNRPEEDAAWSYLQQEQ